MRLIAKAMLLIVGIAVYGALGEHDRGEGGMIVNIIVVAFLTFVATVAHESGHAIAVLAVKGRVQAVMAIPVEIRFRPTRLMRASRSGHGDLGGFVRYSLGARDSRWRRLAIAGAGPLANILLSIVIGLASGLLRDGFGQDIMIALSILSFGMAVGNLVPFKGSDGAHIVEAARQMLRASRRRVP